MKSGWFIGLNIFLALHNYGVLMAVMAGDWDPGCIRVIECTKSKTVPLNVTGQHENEILCPAENALFELHHFHETVAHRGRERVWGPATYPFGPSAFRAAVARNDAQSLGTLRHFAHRLAICNATSGPLIVVVLGGSVVHGRNTKIPYPKRLEESLRATNRNCDVRVRNMGRSGTSTPFAITLFNAADTSDADLVILDHTVNDIQLLDDDLCPYIELLVRRIFDTSTKWPTVMFFSTLSSIYPHDYNYQDNVLEPVARKYGLPLVSYRDAVHNMAAALHPGSSWQSFRDTRSCWSAAHPDWFGHLLMADLITVAIAVVARSHDVKDVPPAEVSRSALGASPFFTKQGANTCNGKYLTEKLGSEYANFAPLGVPGNGWTFVSNNTKSGWEYDASGDVGKTIADMPQIRFPVSFGNNPGLVVSNMMSYENFGPGCFWLENSKTANFSVANDAVEAGRALLDHCWSVQNERHKHHRGGAHEFMCHKVNAGNSFHLPFIVGSHWKDHSSQSVPHFFELVGTVPKPVRYPTTAKLFAPLFQNDTLGLPNSMDVLVFVALPPRNKEEKKLGTKIRITSVQTC